MVPTLRVSYSEMYRRTSIINPTCTDSVYDIVHPLHFCTSNIKTLQNDTLNAIRTTKKYANTRNLLRCCTLNVRKYYILVR